jgi:hypothetical protein
MELKLKLKEFELKDGRHIAKFLIKTGLKNTLFAFMFPKENENLPKNWLEMRKHLQDNYGMTDLEFKDFKVVCEDDLNIAINKYRQDFPSPVVDIGSMLIDTVIEVFADDVKYDALVALVMHLYNEPKEVVEALSLPEVIALVQGLMKDSGFLGLWQPSTPPTETVEETQA